MFELAKIQKALKDFGFDGWLFFDFHRANILAHRVLDFQHDALFTRRFYYMVPAEGEGDG